MLWKIQHHVQLWALDWVGGLSCSDCGCKSRKSSLHVLGLELRCYNCMWSKRRLSSLEVITQALPIVLPMKPKVVSIL